MKKSAPPKNIKLGEFIAGKLNLKQNEVKKLLTMQEYLDDKIGEIAIRNGFIDKKELEGILELQKKKLVTFGNAAIYLNYMKNSQVKYVLDIQAQEKNRLGELLVKRKIISHQKLLELLDEFYSERHVPLTILGLLRDSLTDEILEALKPYHYKFYPCKTGEDFVALAKALKPQLMLLDQEKEKILQYARKARGLTGSTKAKIAFFSREKEKMETLVGYKFGMDYILPLPFDTKNLVNIIIDTEIHYSKKNKQRILVVDDSLTIRQAVAEELMEAGYRVIFADNGKEGVEIAKLEEPDLITMDIEMPVMNGYEACKNLKSNHNTSHIPIIILTSRNTQEEREKGFEVGATEYFVKPFTKGHLGAYIRHLLAGGEEVRKEKVLFADASLISRHIYESIFKKHGFKYEMAENGKEVLDALEKGAEPWAIVMGCYMPVMDGFQACQKIKGEEKYRHIPIILVTSANKKEDILKGLKIGAEDYIIKPFDEDELIARVEAHIKNFKLFKALQKQNHIILEKGEELKNEKEKVELANKIVMDSIEYAERIQRSILPNFDELRERLPDSFFVWRPRDIVGGDIFFTHFSEDGFLITIIDCTGHGVPGALMTMIVNSCLRTIVFNEGTYKDPGKLLKRLNVMVKSTLRQETEEAPSDDGLDAAVCFVDPKGGALRFAGARLSLYYSSNGGINIISGDKMSLGYKKSDPGFEFTNHTIGITKDISIYLTTDGLYDQLGGKKHFPFGKRRFMELLVKNKNKPFPDQGALLLKAFEEYVGDENIRDDVTVIGFKPAF